MLSSAHVGLGVIASSWLLGAPADVLRWSAPKGCPSEAQVRERIEQLEPELEVADVEANARVVADAEGYTLSLSVATTSGGQTNERTLADPSCETLADATALAVVLALDPDAGGALEPIPDENAEADAEPTPEPAPAVPAAEKRVPDAAAPAPSKREAPTPGFDRAALELSAYLGGTLGSLPGPMPTLGGALTYGWRRWSLGVRGAHEFERSTGAGEPGVAVRNSYGAVVTGPRFVVRRRAVVQLEGGVELGVARGRGFRVPSPAVDRVFWRAALVGAGVRVLIVRGLFVESAVDLRVSLGTVRFIVQNDEVLHTLGPLAGAARVGAGYRF